MDPLISVIIPVYNGQDYIAHCLESVCRQTYSRLEMIVVNDGSKDDTQRVCEQEAEKINRVEDGGAAERSMKIITLGDEGVSAARNRALDAAQGEYVAFVDADDRILPDMIQLLYDTVCGTQSDVAGCKFSVWRTEEDWQQLCETARLRGGGWASYGRNVYEPGTYCEKEILKGNSRCWSKLYRREAIGDLRFTKRLTIGEDMLFLVQLQSRLTRIAEIDFAGYGYYQNPGGAMNRKFTKSAMDQITCWEMARDILADEPQMDSFVLVSAMLVAGRLAVLTKAERAAYCEEIAICRQKVKQNLNRRSFGLLDTGYKCKVLLFLAAPALYMALYHVWKS